MKWMNKLERKFGRLAIPNLALYIVILYGVGFLLSLVEPEFYGRYLCLNAEMILKGQVWRLVTFLIQPLPYHWIVMVLGLYMYYSIGRQLEYAWGTFKFNLYYFMGVFFNILGVFIAYFFGINILVGTVYLNLALFLSFASLYPNQRVYVLFVIPIKIKWIAWLEVAFLGYSILTAIIFGEIGVALEIIVALLNFVIFYFATRKGVKRTFAQKKQKKQFDKSIREAKQKPKYENGAKHRCHVCGRTELDDETLEFRYCSKCNGNYEYCQDHLFTHEHIK